MEKQVLRNIVQEQKTLPSPDSTRRELLPEILKVWDDKRILVLTGLRRTGKSTLLGQLRVLKKGCYVNFEDERFLDFSAQEFHLLEEVLEDIFPGERTYFFDEIQNIPHFEAYVRRLHDQGKKVIITGSNATRLSTELATKLTGTYKAFEVLPFSFREYLAFHKVEVIKEWKHSLQQRVALYKWLELYAMEGGLPEYIHNKDIEYIRMLYENVLYKDIIARYAIRRQRIFKELIHLLIHNTANPMTYNALKKTLLLSNAITVKEYIGYLLNSYFFFEVQKMDFSLRKQLIAPTKMYLIDQRFPRLLSLQENKGRILENIVYLELRRRKGEIFYHHEKKECDFVIKHNATITQVIQVCHSFNNQERETQGLLEAMRAYKLKSGTIITWEQNLTLEDITVVPLLHWLLEEP